MNHSTVQTQTAGCTSDKHKQDKHDRKCVFSHIVLKSDILEQQMNTVQVDSVAKIVSKVSINCFFLIQLVTAEAQTFSEPPLRLRDSLIIRRSSSFKIKEFCQRSKILNVM